MTESAQDRLITALREHALVIGDITLTSGQKAGYYVDVKRATLLPEGFSARSELVAVEAERVGATAVGGTTMGADPIACSALAAGAPVKAFFVRKERKEHGLSRWIEGPPLEAGERCLVVEDVVTTGGSPIHPIERGRGKGRPRPAPPHNRRRIPGAPGPPLARSERSELASYGQAPFGGRIRM